MPRDIENPVDGPRGQALWDRADKVLPGGGVYMSRSADFAGRGVLPGFIERAEGCRVTDADGRTYIDFMGANGPNLLGYRHPEIEAAARRQADQFNSASLLSPALVEVIEQLVARFRGMAWGVASKTGSEVVSLGVRIARQHTGRRAVLTFARAYHGNDPELALAPAALPLIEQTAQIHRLPWNDAQAVSDYAKGYGENVAAIVLNPLDQSPGMKTRGADPDFIAALERFRQHYGVQLVFDDVRHGFRLHPEGSFRLLGVDPDLVALGKALGNGYSISALLGKEHLRQAARKIRYTSTYIFEAPPMAAAMAVLEIYDRDQVFDHMMRMGERLQLGLCAGAQASGHAISYTGPFSMPTLLLENDPNGKRLRRFAREAAERGAILHPNLNWNLSGAHTHSDIDETIEIAAAAFASTPPA